MNYSFIIKRIFSVLIDVTFNIITALIIISDVPLFSKTKFSLVFSVLFTLNTTIIPIIVSMQSQRKQTIGDVIMRIKMVDLLGNELTFGKCLFRQLMFSFVIVYPFLSPSVLSTLLACYLVFGSALINIEQMSAWDYFGKTKMMDIK